jgi:protein-S-isoprenylcysteine O-methyltransferase Ste14
VETLWARSFPRGEPGLAFGFEIVGLARLTCGRSRRTIFRMTLPEGSTRPAWWKGERGEWYVVTQLALFALVAVGPRTLPWLPTWPALLGTIATALGALLMLAGGGFLLAALLKLGRNLTPLPFPKDDGALVETGPYRWVRHPIYAAAIALAFGWALCLQAPLTFAYAVALFVLFDLKSRREERWLCAKYAGYGDYQKRTRRLIPFVY